jgi:hypothetical protein
MVTTLMQITTSIAWWKTALVRVVSGKGLLTAKKPANDKP